MSAVPALEFTVLGASCVEDAAAPTLRVDLGVSESAGLEVFTIALTAQINIDPSRRSYDPETRERLIELFGEPERWSATTHSFLWAYSSALVPSFTGTTTFSLPIACTYDLEVAATKYFAGLPGGARPAHVPLQRLRPAPRLPAATSRWSRSPGRARPAGGCRSTRGGG